MAPPPAAGGDAIVSTHTIPEATSAKIPGASAKPTFYMFDFYQLGVVAKSFSFTLCLVVLLLLIIEQHRFVLYEYTEYYFKVLYY